MEDINLLQGRVATCSRCGGLFNHHFTADLLLSMSVSEFCEHLLDGYDKKLVA